MSLQINEALRREQVWRTSRLAVRLAISVALLWLVASVVHLESLLSSLRNVQWWAVMLSTSTVPLILYIDANRTRVLTEIQGLTHTVSALCRISLISSFYSLLLPGLMAGGLVRWQRLSQLDRKPAQAFAVVVFGRMLSIAMTVVVGLVCWLSDEQARADVLWGAILFFIAAVLIALLWFAFLSQAPRAVADWLDQQRWVSPVLRLGAQRVLFRAGDFRQIGMQRLAMTVLLLLANELIALGSFYLLAIALQLPLSPAGVGWTRAYVLLLTVLPISILGLGVREGSLIAMLSAYHVDPASAVAYSTLVLGRTVLAGVLGGCLELNSLVWRRKPATLT